MKKLSVFGAAVCLIALSSCNDEKTTEVVIIEDVVEKEVVSSAFTISVQSQFNGLSEADQTYGKFGVFYCEKGDNTDDLFARWLGGDNSVVYSDNKQVSSSKLTRKRVVNLDGRGGFNILMEGLTPNKEYCICAYFENEFGENRKMGKIRTIKTKDFNPVVTNLGTGDPFFFAANTKSQILNLDSVDGKFCSFGVQYSQADQDLNDGLEIVPEGNVVSGSFEVKLSSLNASTEYHFRPFLTVKTTDTLFGEIKSFSTRNYDEATVDMGTSVLWSKYFLGAESDDEHGDYYRFGLVDPVKMGGKYAFVDNSGYFNEECPENISGTEYDAAKKRLGGKWRIPTREEINELLSKVQINPVGASDPYKTKLRLSNSNGEIVLPQTGYCYAYTRKATVYSNYAYIDFIAADLTVSEPVKRVSMYYIADREDVMDRMNELAEEYFEIHPDAQGVSSTVFYPQLIEEGMISVDTVIMSYKYMTLYEPNNYMELITPSGQYNGELRDNEWRFINYTLSYGDYGFNILPVRDRD
ncbi:MAG: hypothetical protein IKO33_03095 [Bacteroidaceae bacterium]|nr:hypothetical protein [Bacteroidaceae bacterium]